MRDRLIACARWRRRIARAVALAGCSTPQVHHTVEVQAISLQPGQLESHGIAFITPSAATGQEEEKQAGVLLFAKVPARQRERARLPRAAAA